MASGRAGAGVAALPNGNAVVTGGFTLTIDVPTSTFVAALSETTDRFVGSNNTFTPSGPMAAGRVFPVMTALPDGTILILGGGPPERRDLPALTHLPSLRSRSHGKRSR
jgi:hypothetical protein